MKKTFLILTSLFLLSCETKETKIEKGDIVSTCIVDSVWYEQPPSTIEFEGTFYYRTTCGNVLTTKTRQSYLKGDTITFVKKVKK